LTALLAFVATANRAEAQQNLTPRSAAGDNGSAAFEGMIEGLSSNMFTSLVLNEVGKLPNLTSLSLRDLRFDQSDLAQLSSTKKLTVLQITPQEQVTLSKKSLDALCQLLSLESLTMNNVSISPERIGLLGKIQTLRKLALNDSNITDESIGAMRGLSNLEELSLRDTKMGDDGVAAISKQFPKLTHLSLARTSITDAALDHINAIENLEQLSVEWTKISGGELQRLTDLGKLKQISIGDKQIGEQDESQFKRDRPSISLVILR
jgi:hypothetical protein